MQQLLDLIPSVEGVAAGAATAARQGGSVGDQPQESRRALAIPAVPPTPKVVVGPQGEVWGVFRCPTLPPAAPLALEPPLPRRVLALDNDETTGSYQLGSLLFSMYTQLCGTPPSVHYFVEEYLRKGGARPGTAELLQHAAHLIRQGVLDEVVIFTAASNHNGWVDFLRASLEEFAGVPYGTISRIIAGEDCRTRDSATGRAFKDLRLVSQDSSQVLIIDDKPDFVQHGEVVAVGEYRQHVPIDHLVQAMPCSPERRAFALEALRQDQAQFHPCTTDFSRDCELFYVMQRVSDFFNVSHPPASVLTLPPRLVERH